MNKQQDHGGLTLVELLIAAVLLGVMVFGVGQLIMSGTEAQEFAKRLNRVTEVNQDILDQMRLELVSSVRLFGDNATDRAYLDLLDLGGAPARLPGSVLPTIRTSGIIDKDIAGSAVTGNMLLFARLAWSDHHRCSSGREYAIDVYRWIHYYLAAETPGPRPGSADGLNLVRVLSEPLIDGGQIDRIGTAADRDEVLLHLANATPDLDGSTHAAAAVVWNRGGLPAAVGTLRQIDPDSGALSDVPIAPRTAPWVIERAEDGVEELLSFRHHSVATVYALPAMGVGRFGIVDTAGSGFPHGFEVQLIGPTAGRQVLLHLVVVSTNRRGQVAYSDMQSVVDARDL